MNKTPLHPWHLTRRAKMASFGGHDMPLWYSSVKDEHCTVLTQAGLFDTGHMATIAILGPDARQFIQTCFTKDIERGIGSRQAALSPGRCIYGAF